MDEVVRRIEARLDEVHIREQTEVGFGVTAHTKATRDALAWALKTIRGTTERDERQSSYARLAEAGYPAK